jgi:predicted metal-dependent HD superfamily phosphohydrolase
VSSEIELRTAWTMVARRGVPSRRAEDIFDDVLGRYRQSHRRYHGVRHLTWVVRHVRALAAHCGPVDLAVVVAAAFFHDAVYDPAAGDNEERSAQLAQRQLPTLQWPAPDVTAAAEHVRATASHVTELPPAGEGAGLHADRSVLLDADLAVLAAAPSAYQAYVDGVRAEYRHLDAATWRHGRTAVLTRLIERPHLYLTEPGREWWEASARANVAAELARLR